MTIAVIGAGSWGTAIASVLATNGHEVSLWARDTAAAASINKERRNPRYLSEHLLHEGIVATADLAEAVAYAQAVVVVTPSKSLREIAGALQPLVGEDTPILVCTKGVEEDTGFVPCQIFAEVLGNESRLAALSGPNHAEEIILGVPAATVIASTSSACAEYFQGLFANENFRVYTSPDVLGVELCAAIKNIVAIACGVSYGVGFGDNTAAMIITRGMAEMARLVRACGGEERTCMGLAGTGDLIATCMSEHSRNRRFGRMVAEGFTLEDFTAKSHMVAEGAYACKSVCQLAEKLGVDVPIAKAVRSVVWEGASPQEMGRALLDRDPKPEFY